jgi:hypothetical protein
MRLLRPLLATATLVALSLPAVATAASHPRLLFKTAQELAELQQRQLQQPWAGMVTAGISESKGVYPMAGNVRARLESMTDIVGGASLAYLVETDPTARATYFKRTLDAINRWTDVMTPRMIMNGIDGPDVASHDFVVDGGSAAFTCLLALDVMDADLSGTQRKTAVAQVQLYIDWLKSVTTQWNENRWGILGTWAVYNGDTTTPTASVANTSYRDILKMDILATGPHDEGPGYGQARFAGTRLAKAYWMDVASYNGVYDWYDSSMPSMKNFFEWVFAGTLTPRVTGIAFGDSDVIRYSEIREVPPAVLRTERFSAKAATNAAWAVAASGNKPPKGTLLSYILMRQKLPEGAQPTSQMWPDASAALWDSETTQPELRLMGTVWSPTHTDKGSHAHADVNSINLFGYGENLLRNVGYAGFNNGCVPTAVKGETKYSWDYVHTQAVSNNVVLIGDGAYHASTTGGGITEGLFADLFDYTSSDAGAAIDKATHQRGFALVHPQDSKGGYFLLLDEVSGVAAPGTKIRVVLHPSSKAVAAKVAGESYDYKAELVLPALSTVQSPALHISFGTPPDAVKEASGGLCALITSMVDPSFEGVYLDASYSPDAAGQRNIVTVLFPHDKTHPDATVTRVKTGDHTGAVVDLGGGVVDTVLETGGTSPVTEGSVSFAARFTTFRQTSAGLAFYFVRKGTSFSDGQPQPHGFTSTAPVSFHVRDLKGQITGPAATVTFRHPGLSAVQIDGLKTMATVLGSVAVDLAPGTHSVLYEVGGVVPGCDAVASCLDSDGCCPQGCSPQNDSDCVAAGGSAGASGTAGSAGESGTAGSAGESGGTAGSAGESGGTAGSAGESGGTAGSAGESGGTAGSAGESGGTAGAGNAGTSGGTSGGGAGSGGASGKGVGGGTSGGGGSTSAGGKAGSTATGGAGGSSAAGSSAGGTAGSAGMGGTAGKGGSAGNKAGGAAGSGKGGASGTGGGGATSSDSPAVAGEDPGSDGGCGCVVAGQKDEDRRVAPGIIALLGLALARRRKSAAPRA